MSRRDETETRQSRYASVKTWVEKQGSGSVASYLKVPKGMPLFTPKEGVMLLDILAYEVGKGNPDAEEGSLYWQRTFFVHRGIGPNQEMVICPARTANEPCPICEYRAGLSYSEDDEQAKEAKALAPKERQVMNVINRKEPDKGVQLFTTSYHTFGEAIKDELNMAEEGDQWELFFTYDQGFTLKIGFGEDQMGKNKFIRADSIHFKDRKPFSQKEEDELLKEVAPLDDILIIKPYDELKKLFTQSAARSEDNGDRGRGRGRSRRDEAEGGDEREERGRGRRGSREEPEEREERGSRRGRGDTTEEEPRGRGRREEPEPEPEERSERRGRRDEPEERGGRGGGDEWENEREAPRGRGRREEPESEPESRGRGRREEPEDRGSEREERSERRSRRDEPEPEPRGRGKGKDKDKEGSEADDGWDNFEPRGRGRGGEEPEEQPRGRGRREESEGEERPRVRTQREEEAEDRERDRGGERPSRGRR